MSVAISIAAFIVSLFSLWLGVRQNLYALALEVHRDLTSGPVADARDVLGTFSIQQSDEPINEDKVAGLLNAYFTLLWAFERAERARRTMRCYLYFGPRSFLKRSIRWHVRECSKLLADARVALTNALPESARKDTPNLDDVDSVAQFTKLYENVVPERERELPEALVTKPTCKEHRTVTQEGRPGS